MLAKLLSLMMAFLSMGQGVLDSYVQQTNLGGLLYLVNRQFPLTERFEPDDLLKPNVLLAYGDITMKADAARALEKLFAAAELEEGYRLMGVSGYRSYGRQRAIYQRKIDSTGSVKKAQLLVAPPGTSEHQLGLAMDVGRKASQNLNAGFGKSPEGKWLAANAHRFGFIIRYKAEWTDITGYAYEPWHIRYVGPEHAERIHQLDIPLESYVEMLIEAQLHQEFAEERRAS